jgi:hypothetical protein
MSEQLSDEQQKVVERALQGFNVRVRAVPGAGKTHTCMALQTALEAMGVRVLTLTYSAVLRRSRRSSAPRRPPRRSSRPRSTCTLTPPHSSTPSSRAWRAAAPP